MKIETVIERADELYPNHYSRKTKLGWCYHLSADLAENVRKLYDLITYEAKPEGEAYLLPEGVLWEDVKSLFVDGIPFTKTDLRSFLIFGGDREFAFLSNLPKGKVEVIYKLRLLEYEDQVYEGGFMCGVDFINIPGHKLLVGDSIKITMDSGEKTADVLEVDGDIIKIESGILNVNPGVKQMKVELILQDETLCPAPFDEMYVQYVLSQIAYYQNDFELYNKYIATYNVLYDEYVRWYKGTNPIDMNLKFSVRW